MPVIFIPCPAISVVQIRQLSGIRLQLILSGFAGYVMFCYGSFGYEAWSHSIAETGLEVFLILLTQPFRCLDHVYICTPVLVQAKYYFNMMYIVCA